MRQSFAISSSAFGREKKKSVCYFSCADRICSLPPRPNIPPLLNQMGQYQPNMSSADPGVLIQLEHKCWAGKETVWMWGSRKTGIHNFRWTGDGVKDGSWDAAGSISGLMAGVLMGPIRRLSVRITTPTGPAPTNESDRYHHHHHHHQDPGFIPWGINVKTLKLVKKVRQTSWIQTLYPDQNQKLITSALGWDSIRV